MKMKTSLRILMLAFSLGATSAALAAQTAVTRFDSDIQNRVTQQLAKKPGFQRVQASTEDGIVTLRGAVDLYQQKLDAANKVRKMDKVQGVRNLIEVRSTAPDAQLEAQLERKLHYDRVGYDNMFNFVSISVKDGVATLGGETRIDTGRDSALALANRTPGVKDVVNDIKVAPVSNFDDRIRFSAMRAIYHDSVLGRYASDPAKPIRIVVDNGKLALYGTVENTMDKNIAGIRASQVPGVFRVENHLEVAQGS